MHVSSCFNNKDYNLGRFKVSRTDISALVVGAALLSVGATFMHLTNLHSDYWYLSMTGVITGGLTLVGEIASVSKKSFFSGADNTRSSTDSNVNKSSVSRPNFFVYAPAIRPLFIKHAQLTFNSVEEEQECKQKLETFDKWYQANRYIFSTIEEDAQADQFHKLMVDKLFEVTSSINALPAEFDKEKVVLKKKFIENCSEYFLGAFRKSTQTMEPKAKKEPFKICTKNIFFYLTSKFSHNGTELKFIVDELTWGWQLVGSILAHGGCRRTPVK